MTGYDKPNEGPKKRKLGLFITGISVLRFHDDRTEHSTAVWSYFGGMPSLDNVVKAKYHYMS